MSYITNRRAGPKTLTALTHAFERLQKLLKEKLSSNRDINISIVGREVEQKIIIKFPKPSSLVKEVFEQIKKLEYSIDLEKTDDKIIVDIMYPAYSRLDILFTAQDVKKEEEKEKEKKTPVNFFRERWAVRTFVRWQFKVKTEYNAFYLCPGGKSLRVDMVSAEKVAELLNYFNDYGRSKFVISTAPQSIKVSLDGFILPERKEEILD